MADDADEGVKKFRDETSPAGRYERFRELRRRNEVEENFDFTITFNGRSYQLHQEVLETNTHFDKMINCGLNEAQTRAAKLECTGMTEEGFATFVEYLYTGSIGISAVNIADICFVADYFMDERILKHCQDFIENDVTISNVVHYISLVTDHYGLFESMEKLEELFVRNFEQIVEEGSFTDCPFSFLASTVLESSDLVAYDEGAVLRACCKWVGAEPASRNLQLEQLLGKVRLRFLAPDMLTAALSASFMNGDMTSTVIDYIQNNDPSSDPPSHATPRKYRKGIYIMDVNEIIQYTPGSDELIEVSSQPLAIPPPDIIELGGQLYLVHWTQSSLRRFVPAEQAWGSPTPFPVDDRNGICAFPHNGKLYLFFRAYPQGPNHQFCQIYTPSTDTWEVRPSTLKLGGRLQPHSALSLGEKLLAYNFSETGSFWGMLIDPETFEREELLVNLPKEDHFHHVVEYEGKLLFFGYTRSVFNGDLLNQLIVYDPITRDITTQCSFKGLIDPGQMLPYNTQKSKLDTTLKIIRQDDLLYVLMRLERSEFEIKQISLSDIFQRIPGHPFSVVASVRKFKRSNLVVCNVITV